MKNTTNTLIIILSLFCIKVKSQSIDPPKSLDIIMQVATNDNTMQPGDSLFKPNTNLIGKAIIVLNDTVGISKFHIKLGTNNGMGDLLTKTFIFDQQGNFSDGTSYNRNKNIIYLSLGNFTGLNTYYSEVYLEDAQGSFTSVVKYNN